MLFIVRGITALPITIRMIGRTLCYILYSIQKFWLRMLEAIVLNGYSKKYVADVGKYGMKSTISLGYIDIGPR